MGNSAGSSRPSSRRHNTDNIGDPAPNRIQYRLPNGSAASGERGQVNQQRTVCNRCHSTLLVPPGAATFRCPCGTIFSVNGRNVSPLQAPSGQQNAQERSLGVICGSCRNLALLPPGTTSGLFMCACGSPLLVPAMNGSGNQRGRMSVGNIGGNHAGIIRQPVGNNRAAGASASHSEGGMSRALLSQLPSYSFSGTEGPKEKENEDGDECRICFGEYEDGEKMRLLPCFHRFHQECVDEWLLRNKHCPLCNGAVDEMMGQQSGMM